MRRVFSWVHGVTLMMCCFLWAALPLAAQFGNEDGEWPSYGGDVTSHRYSPLDQINASNFSKLEVAWRFKTDNLGPSRRRIWKARPSWSRVSSTRRPEHGGR